MTKRILTIIMIVGLVSPPLQAEPQQCLTFCGEKLQYIEEYAYENITANGPVPDYIVPTYHLIWTYFDVWKWPRIQRIDHGFGDVLFEEEGDAGPQHGFVHQPGKTDNVVYNPDNGYVGKDQFETSGGTIYINVKDKENNTQPSAVDDVISLNENGSKIFNVITNDSDPDGDYFGYRTHTAPEHGTLVQLDEESFEYTPNPGFSGQDYFVYTIFDGFLKDSAQVFLNVSNQNNDNPQANDDVAATSINTAVNISVLNNDWDTDQDVLSITGNSNPSNGNVVDNGNDTFSYTPNSSFTGIDSFTYQISDGNGGSGSATVRINVNSTNVAPVGTLDEVETNQGIMLDVLANDTDLDEDALGILSVNQPVNGTVQLVGSQLKYTPKSNFSGADAFTYTLTDGELTNEVTVVVTVTNGAGATLILSQVIATESGSGDNVRVWPHRNDSKGGKLREFFFGGLPHLANLQDTIDVFISRVGARTPPDGDDVWWIDNEVGWWPHWGKTEEDRYRIPMRNLIRHAHPQMDEDQVEADAKAVYMDGARDFLLGVLSAMKQLRPNTRWGQWNVPFNDYYCNEPHCPNGVGLSSNVKEMHDEMGWLWEWTRDNNGFLGTSLFLKGLSTDGSNQAQKNIDVVTQLVEENLRIEQIYGGGPDTMNIFGGVWVREGPSPFRALVGEDFHTEFILPLELGADALIHHGIGATAGTYQNNVIPLLTPYIGDICNLTYTINTSWGLGGSIVPGGSITYPISQESTYTMSPDEGFYVNDVLIDNESVGPKQTQDFRLLCSEHDLHANFTDNPPPVAVNDEGATDFDTPITVDVLANDTDANEDPLTIPEEYLVPSQLGTTEIVDNKIIYTPLQGTPVTAGIKYRAFDGTTLSNEATVTIGVNFPAQNLVAGNDNADTLVNTPVVIDVLSNDGESEQIDDKGDDGPGGGHESGLTIDINSLIHPVNGAITITTEQMIQYIPNENFSGTDIFKYKARKQGSLSNEATVSVNVINTGGAPLLDDITRSILRQSTGGGLSMPYILAQASDVSLKIYNRRGRIVFEKNYGFQPAGHYRPVWYGKNNNGKKVASGLYFYIYEIAGEFIEKVKFVVIK